MESNLLRLKKIFFFGQIKEDAAAEVVEKGEKIMIESEIC